MAWQPADNRYDKMIYNRVGRSGLKLPAVSLGLWHNFGGDTPHDRKVDMCRTLRGYPRAGRPTFRSGSMVLLGGIAV